MRDGAFYEGRWAWPDLSAGSLRNWLVKKERFFLRQLGGRRGRVADLGCGGGWRFYTRLGPVVGVDISYTSLEQAHRLYGSAVQADLSALPFRDASFDFVVSSDVLGHIPLELKDTVVQEVWRALRPGGRTLHYIEADGQDPLMRWAKRHPKLYEKYILAPEGHIGMETPAATLARFRRAGFRPVREVAAYRGLMYLGRIVQLFDNEYCQESCLVKGLVGVCKVATRSRPLEMAGNLLVALLLELGDRLLPVGWAHGVMVCYQKE